MAIYHLAVKSVSRSTGRSAVAAAAYRTGACLENERDGLVHDYTRRGGVEDAFIVAPEGAEWAQDRSALWNAAEAAEAVPNALVRASSTADEVVEAGTTTVAVMMTEPASMVTVTAQRSTPHTLAITAWMVAISVAP